LGLKDIYGRGISDTVNGWVDEFNRISQESPELKVYVKKSVENIAKAPPGKYLNVSILEIFWKILALPPFTNWKDESGEKTYRLGQLTKIIEAYASTPLPRHPGSNRGLLRTSTRPNWNGKISKIWLDSFYYSIIGLLSAFGLDDPEDEEMIVPEGQFPIMTVHQAKGLEFDFVFYYGVNHDPRLSSAICLEKSLSDYRISPLLVNFSPDQKAAQDLVRFYYVAYSRAKYALIYLIPDGHMGNNFGVIGKNPNLFKKFVSTEVNG
ncbi:3'-5' exonuclease, partial [Methanocalculus sp.]|uniref:3'-5' exonuclease n=1 Tax=Methanocalculus sp. TaxID=2004547 RepID=UPI002632A0A2